MRKTRGFSRLSLLEADLDIFMMTAEAAASSALFSIHLSSTGDAAVRRDR
jgi:hypothetical protein